MTNNENLAARNVDAVSFYVDICGELGVAQLPRREEAYTILEVMVESGIHEGWTGYDVRLNGQRADAAAVVKSGDNIQLRLKQVDTFVPLEKVEVTVVSPGVREVVVLPHGSVVAHALKAAGVENSPNTEIRLRGTVSSADAVLANGDTVFVMVKIKGNLH